MDLQGLNQLIRDTHREFQLGVVFDIDDLVEYTLEQMIFLSAMVGESGFDKALLVALEFLALKANINDREEVGSDREAMNQRILGIFHGVLVVGSTLI